MRGGWRMCLRLRCPFCICPCSHFAFARATFPFLVYKVPRPQGSAFWIPMIQVFASFNLLVAIMMSVNLIKIRKRHWWQSCYLWAVWIGGPLGFGLLLSCRIVQAFQLYFIFVKKRLPPIRSFIFLPLILLPWIAGSVFVHVEKPLNYRCEVSAWWIIPAVSLHLFYVALLVGFMRAIQHVEFKFHELKDLWQGILFSTSSVGVWVAAYILNKIHENVEWIEIASRFVLLLMANIFIQVFFSMSSSQPLLSQMSLRRKQHPEIGSMGKALGISDSEIQSQWEQSIVIDSNEPLDKLLLNKKFRSSFMAFADSCLAGESVRFYSEVHELDKLPFDDSVRRIYIARHIIENYIVAGAAMEVNISHRNRQEILTTSNLAHPDLFKTAVKEVLQLMEMNLAKDYWSSVFYTKFKEESGTNMNGHDLELLTSWNASPRLSSVHAADDPFHKGKDIFQREIQLLDDISND
ncbi:hypothetical protein Nepgr_032937 [Nepenthes gracilis]|uniref:RGS domain-containing protein n=1 Tax=Nepenthes gracilis TaxID=150966 RepID=A0AAD3Y898_NEPGR|nr:hypothetical protein Nepgr_032937 [Nepenthes gracilis]